MRILVLNSEYPPLGGCAARTTEELFRAFGDDANIQIDCITSALNNTSSEEKLFPNIHLYRVPVGDRNTPLHHPSYFNLIRYVIEARRLSQQLVEKHHYDLVHAFFTLPAGLVAFFHRKKIPYIISLQGSDVPHYNDAYSSVYFFGKPLFQLIWKSATAVIANSMEIAALARYAMPRLPVPVIQNGVDLDLFCPARTEPSPHEQFRIVCVSRKMTRKNIHVLLQAVASLRHQYGHIYIEIVGDRSENQELIRLTDALKLNDRVHFTGTKQYTELPDVYRNAHVFVLPAKNDSISNTALEAMASGLPIVLTDTGSGKLLASGNGIVVPPNNQMALMEAIKQLLTNPSLRLAFRRESRAKSLKYRWEATAEHYRELYERMIKQHQVV